MKRFKFWSGVLLGLTSLSFTASAADTEAHQACGSISGFLNPPITQDLHKVTIDRLNDKNVASKGSYNVEPGTYKVKVYEQIKDDRMSVSSTDRGTSKTIEIEVQANKRYHLAAKFIPEKRFSKTNQYWEPVVWQITDEACELK